MTRPVFSVSLPEELIDDIDYYWKINSEENRSRIIEWLLRDVIPRRNLLKTNNTIQS